MRVKYKAFGFDRETTLEKALMTDTHRSGVAEAAKANAEHANEQIARLLAHLVECGQIELEAAFSIAGIYVEELEVVG